MRLYVSLNQTKKMSLNPYSNGICSMRRTVERWFKTQEGLNPYSNGICSMSCSTVANRFRA